MKILKIQISKYLNKENENTEILYIQISEPKKMKMFKIEISRYLKQIFENR